MELLPWHQSLWAHLQQCHEQGRLPHGLILHGPGGVGKENFSRRLAGFLLCLNDSTPLQEACGHCAACKLYRASTHPDLYELDVPEGKKNIGIDQVREVVRWQGMKSHLGGYKVVRIKDAHKMSISAANALLKTLEEPSGDTVLILLTPNPGWLLPTIRSRCRALKFGLPPRQLALEYLKKHAENSTELEMALAIAGGAPLTALHYLEQNYLAERKKFFLDFQGISEGREFALPVAGRWYKRDPLLLQSWLAGWCRDLIRLKIMGKTSLTSNSDLAPDLARIAQRLGARELYKFLDQLTDMLSWADRNLNIQLQLENLLWSWQQLVTRSSMAQA